jgi:hypothetical protein
MNALIIDIRDTCLRAVLSNNGVLEYCRSFDFTPLHSSALTASDNTTEAVRIRAKAAENPYLLYYDTTEKNPWDLALKEIIKQIRSDINTSFDSVHLIIPSEEVIVENHQLPKMAKQDAQKLIGRRISAETKEEFPPFTILPTASDQKTQSWYSLYIPTTTLKDYKKAFSSCRVRLTSITTPINAMIDGFHSVREAIFNAHAIFEIQLGSIEAFYITADGILHFERLPFAPSATFQSTDSEEAEKVQKQKIFKIINTIFSVNSHYQSLHPATPVQMAWVCGLEKGLEDIATALKEAMGIEVGIAPALPTGLADESGYVPLAGYAAALHNNSATTYEAADFFRRFPLRKTSGTIIYTIAAFVTLLAVTLTENEYRNLLKQVKQVQQPTDQKLGTGKSSVSTTYTKNLEALKKVSARQFVFYPLFRELASDVPDGVFLENLEFHLKDDKGQVSITALARLDDKIADNMLLTKFMAMLDRSPTLKNHREPAITVYSRDKERFLKITITCEVNSIDTSK